MPSIFFRFDPAVQSPPQRSATLERWLADATPAAAALDWRREAIGRLSGEAAAIAMPQPAPAALLALSPALAASAAGHGVLIAAPLQTVASMTSVSLPPGGVLHLTAEEAQALAQDFNARIGHDGARLIAGAAGELFCRLDGELRVETRDPDSVRGQDLWACQPNGPDAGRLKKIGSEIEMWLFGHPVNDARRARGEAEVTTLWLWGGGAVLARLPPCPVAFRGADVLFSAWSANQEASAPGAGLIVRCDAAPGSVAFDAAMESLRRSRAERLYLSSGSRCCTVRSMRRRFFFRGARPWWEYFDDSD